MKRVRLGVNVDHIATLRQARGGTFPDPVAMALAAQKAGADSIVCHLREDRRHIQDRDVRQLKAVLKIPLNLEMAAHPEVVRVACRVRPYQATLVPERRQELTTEGGMDLKRGLKRLQAAVQQLQDAGVLVSLFIDPVTEQIRLAAQLGVPIVELHTGRYAQATTADQQNRRLKALVQAACLAGELGLHVAAGHGLDYGNTRQVAVIPEMEELNIGFAVVARALEIGFPGAVQEMLRLIRRG